MKKCINCKHDNRDNDKYCRNCGFYLKNNGNYTLFKVLTISLYLGIIFTIILFVASYCI